MPKNRPSIQEVQRSQFQCSLVCTTPCFWRLGDKPSCSPPLPWHLMRAEASTKQRRSGAVSLGLVAWCPGVTPGRGDGVAESDLLGDQGGRDPPGVRPVHLSETTGEPPVMNNQWAISISLLSLCLYAYVYSWCIYIYM